MADALMKPLEMTLSTDCPGLTTGTRTTISTSGSCTCFMTFGFTEVTSGKKNISYLCASKNCSVLLFFFYNTCVTISDTGLLETVNSHSLMYTTNRCAFG